MCCTTRASTADAPIGGRISSNNSSNEVININIIISININIIIDTTGITTGTGIAINTGEILRKGLVQSLQFHRQGRRTTWGGRRLHPALVSKWIMLDLEHENLTHTHTPHTTQNSQVMPTWILYLTSHIQSPNSRTAVRSKSTSRNLGARRWYFRARACALTWS